MPGLILTKCARAKARCFCAKWDGRNDGFVSTFVPLLAADAPGHGTRTGDRCVEYSQQIGMRVDASQLRGFAKPVGLESRITNSRGKPVCRAATSNRADLPADDEPLEPAFDRIVVDGDARIVDEACESNPRCSASASKWENSNATDHRHIRALYLGDRKFHIGDEGGARTRGAAG
jgi:hypothetical protein